MRHWLYHYCYVHGDVERLDASLRVGVRDIFRAATGAAPDDPPASDGSFVIPLAGMVAGRAVTATVRVTTGVSTHEAGGLRIPVQWHGDRHGHLLPDFDGTLELQPEDDTRAQLTLAGSYRPPLGPFGATVDSTLLSGVTRGTVEHLVAAIGVELERRLSSGPSASHPLPSSPLLQVRDVMSVDPIVLDESAPLTSAAQLLFIGDVSGAPVISGTGRLVGVLSERDLIDKEAPPPTGIGRASRQTERRHDATTVGEACSRPAIITSADALVRDVAALMREQGVGRLVVVEGSEITGMVTRHDILKALIRSDRQLQSAVDLVLAGAHAEHVRATVDWAKITLSGKCETRTQAGELVNRASMVDGLVAIDDQLTWDVDDLPPLLMP